MLFAVRPFNRKADVIAGEPINFETSDLEHGYFALFIIDSTIDGIRVPTKRFSIICNCR